MTTARDSAVLARKRIVMRRPLRKLLAAARVVLVILVALAVAVRMWGYSQRHMYDPIYTSFKGAEDIPYIQKPNLVQVQARGFAWLPSRDLPRLNTIGGYCGKWPWGSKGSRASAHVVEPRRCTRQ